MVVGTAVPSCGHAEALVLPNCQSRNREQSILLLRSFGFAFYVLSLLIPCGALAHGLAPHTFPMFLLFSGKSLVKRKPRGVDFKSSQINISGCCKNTSIALFISLLKRYKKEVGPCEQ